MPGDDESTPTTSAADATATSESGADASTGAPAASEADAKGAVDAAGTAEAAAIAAVERRGETDQFYDTIRWYRVTLAAVSGLVLGLILSLGTGVLLDAWYTTPQIIEGQSQLAQMCTENLDTIRWLHYAGTMLMLVCLVAYLLTYQSFANAHASLPKRNDKRTPWVRYAQVVSLFAFVTLMAAVITGFQLPEKPSDTEIDRLFEARLRADEVEFDPTVDIDPGEEAFREGHAAAAFIPQLDTPGKRTLYEMHGLLLAWMYGFIVLALLPSVWSLQRCKPKPSTDEATRKKPKAR